MSETIGNGFGGVDDWRGHYNTIKGPEKIEARQRVYWLARNYDEAGNIMPRVDLELETINALQHAGVDNDATIVDIGCSFPNFLHLWKLHGHAGRLIGVEPNVKQFDGLPFWSPSTRNLLEQLIGPSKEHSGDFSDLELYEAWADALPLADGEADIATMMLMMYHVPKGLQLTALQEAKRIQDPETGIFALTTRGKMNKNMMHKGEIAIGGELSLMRKQAVVPPPAVNSGFTSEDAALVLPEIYKYVYRMDNNAEIIIDSAAAVGIVERALWSLMDKYVDGEGNPPTEEQFDTAVNNIYGEDFLAVYAGKAIMKDMLHESLFLASDRPLEKPSKFYEL